MNCSCCRTDPKLFNAHVLSTSNEEFCYWFLLMGACGGCQKLNKKTERCVFFLTGANSIKLFLNTFVQCPQNNGMWTEEQDLAMLVSEMSCFSQY